MTHGIARRGLLLVDTDIVFRDELSVALQRFEISLIWRARVLGLLEAIAETDPVAVALSGDLPGGDSIQLIRSIRAHPRWHHLPVYLVASTPTREQELQSLVAGADAVMHRTGAVAEIAARVMGRGIRASRDSGRPDPDLARDTADAALDLCNHDASPPAATGGIDLSDGSIGQPAEAGPSGATTPTGIEPPRETLPLRNARAEESAAAEWPAAARAEPIAASASALPIGVSRPQIDPTAQPLPFIPPEAQADTRMPPATLPVVPDVIIVEDDPSLLEMLQYALTNRGYQTLSFSNGLDALRALREMDTAGTHPVVLLDVDLPGIDGFRILHELSGSRPGVFQIILSTVHNSEATQVLGIQSGALDYLVKPLRMPIVLAKVERLVGRGSYNSVQAQLR